MEPLKVSMLGDFTLRYGENSIQETGNRSRRVWSLLSFLICHSGHPMSQYKLIELLWGSDADLSHPENTLRLLLHRTRSQLDQLYPGAGRACIVRRDGSYCWNPDIPLELDYVRFENLCHNSSEDPAARLEELTEALSLYQGEFLARQASDSWVIPVSTHFQNLFLNASLEAAQLLEQRQRFGEAVQVCRRCIGADPYFEPAYQLLIRNLAAAGDPGGATEVYEDLNRLLFNNFGIRPSEETRMVYRAAIHSPEDRSMSMDEVLEYLQEPEPEPGALQCDYDYFKMLCFAERRALERSGDATHMALLSVSGTADKPLSQRSLNRIMEQFGQTLRGNLRRGDVISRCSTSQYVILLPKANYENSCMVCRRCITAFRQKHAYTNARIHYLVQPLAANYQLP